jgi:hypothetical protein
MAINQLSTSNNFTEWLSATSSLIEVANNLTSNTSGGFIANSAIFIQGAGSSLNVRNHANINTLRANTGNIANTNFDKSNVTIQLDLTVGRNISSIYVYANELYQKGANVLQLAERINPAFSHANSGFIQANSAYIHINSGFNHANSGFIKTNAAFDHANSGFIQANSAYHDTNASFIHANSGFIQANAAFIHANSGFIQANSAYLHANYAFNHANSGFIKTNSSFDHANSSFDQINAAFAHANSGFIQANSAYIHTNAAFNHANSGFIRANNSLDANNGGIVTGAVTIRHPNGLKVQRAVGYDSISLRGSTAPGGYTMTLTPKTLTASRTATFPDEDFTVGFRNIPFNGQKTSEYTLALTDIGKYISIKEGGSVIIPNGVFADGDVITIINNTSADVIITCSITNAFVAGHDYDIPYTPLSPRGIATVIFTSSTSCIIIGNVEPTQPIVA